MVVAGRDPERLQLRSTRRTRLRGIRFIAALFEPVRHLVGVELPEQLEATTRQRRFNSRDRHRHMLS